MPVLVRSSLRSWNANLIHDGFALAGVLTFTLSSACGRSCPQGYVERDSQCVRPTDTSDTDASAQQTLPVEQPTDAGERKPDASTASKPSSMATSSMMSMATKPDASLANAMSGSGGASGASGQPAEASGAGGMPVPMQMEVDMKPRNCLVGATRCSETEVGVEVCTVDDEWVMKEPCPATCQDGACAGDCRPGEHHCGSNQTTEICSDMGVWTPAETCPFVCTDGVCGGDCTPGSLQCGGSDGLTVQTCDESGHWTDSHHCDNICSSGSCSGTCMPNTKRCRTTTIPEECSDDGNWEAKLPCPFVCGDNGECTGECRPGSKVCNDQTPTTCDQSGHWVAGSDCTNVDRACINGVCGGACSPDGPLRCGPDQTPQKCSQTGRWESQRRCQFVCTGAGVCGGTCSPDSKICSSNTLRTCRGDGSGYTDLVCQPAQANETASCSGNTCTSACLEPALRCSGSSLCWRLEYGCEQCVSPYVWREATGIDDKVCVTPDARARSAAENSNPMYPIAESCPAGLTWRLTTRSDHRCVPPEVARDVADENAAGPNRTAVAQGRQP